MRPVPAGLIAGLVGGILLYAGSVGSFGGALLASLAMLPLAFAGLSAGLVAVLVAVATGTVFMVVTGHGGWWVYPLAIGGPVIVLVQRALLARDGTEVGRPGGLVWYPPGLLTVWLAGVVAVLAVLNLALTGEELREGLRANLAATLADLQTQAPAGQAPELTTEQVETWVAWVMTLMPAGWMVMIAINLALAQALAVRFGRNLRPTPRLAELELPRWFAGAFLAALALSLLSGMAGQVGALLAAIAATAYMLHGLGVVHWWAARTRAPGVMLTWVYVLVGLVTPAPVVVLGLVDTWARFRHRGARTGTEE